MTGRRRLVAASLILVVVAAGAALVAHHRSDAPVVTVKADPTGRSSTAVPGRASAAGFDRTLSTGLHLEATVRDNVLAVGDRSPIECVEPRVINIKATTVDGEEWRASAQVPDTADDEFAVVPLTYSWTYLPGKAAPTSLVFAAVIGPSVTGVTAIGEGRTDKVEATDGLALVAILDPPDPASLDLLQMDSTDVELVNGHHITVDTRQLNAPVIVDAAGVTRKSPAGMEQVTSACLVTIPATVPPTGDGLPANGAVEAVTGVITLVADGSVPVQERAQHTDDADRSVQIFNEFPEWMRQQGSTLRATVRDVGFVDRHTAIAIVDLTVDGHALISNQYVKVVEHGGWWLVTWRSVCAAGGSYAPTSCAGTTSDYPPEARRRVR